MAWCALIVMAVVTIVVLIFPERMAAADSIIMMMYGSLSALVGAYFGFAKAFNKGLFRNDVIKNKGRGCREGIIM